MSVVVELERVLPAPVDVVWAHLVDWENQDRWMLEASDFVVTSPHREDIGVEAEATISIAGIKTRDKVRVVAWDPDRHLGVEHLGWVKGRGDLWLTPEGQRTRLRWREEFVAPLGPPGALGLRLFRPLFVRTFRRDLDALAGWIGDYADS